MLRYEYLKEEIKKCDFCSAWIEQDPIVYKRLYYHRFCFNILNRLICDELAKKRYAFFFS